MAGFVKGDIVVIPFSFSDLSGNKKRPALVLADLPGDDIILCQITSQQKNDKFAIALNLTDFESGSLPLFQTFALHVFLLLIKTLLSIKLEH